MIESRRVHREELTLNELAATEVGRGTARALTWAFVASLIAVPLLQTLYERQRGLTPPVVRLVAPLRDGIACLTRGEERQAWSAVQPMLTAAHLRQFEQAVEKTSVARRIVRPRLQTLLVRYGNSGNDTCLVGHKGWLFYQPGVRYLTGPDFLAAEQLRARAKQLADQDHVRDPQPDPRPAIRQLHEDCRRAGVHLVVVPIPDKAMLQPSLLGHWPAWATRLPVANNPGYSRLVRQLREEGIDVFEPAPPIVGRWEYRFLRHDTHWTPAFMEETAASLAEHIRQTVALPPPARRPSTSILERFVSHSGDLLDMLRLPQTQTIFTPQQVLVRQIMDARTDRPWMPDATADVLLLGDSFTNVYSDGEGKEGLGWGRSAGFAPQLAHRLGRPVDVIARNGAGASGVRVELARRPRPLAGKRVLVWEFASRDLALADWKRLPLSGSGPRNSLRAGKRSAGTGPLVVQATVVAVSRVPAPFTVPYKDCLSYVKVRVDRVEQGEFAGDFVIAAFWGMKDNQLQPAAHYRPGDHLRLTLLGQQETSEQSRTARVADDLDDYEHPVFYVQREQGL